MKLWCMLVILFLLTISISDIYSDDSTEKSYPLGQHSSESQLTTFVHDDRLRVKRSQRNANILYRYCRHGGHGRQFCLKYAVHMLYATGH